MTIKEVLGDDWFRLGFPNQEVRNSFASHLLAEYLDDDWANMEVTIAFKLKTHLEREQLKPAFQIFAAVIASTGYDITKHTEGYFHTIMHVLMYSTGMATFSELESLEGRLDTICMGQKAIYIFEFKINGTAKAAIQQIKKQNYAQPFLNQTKTLYLVGVNFLTDGKRINEIEVEKWNGTIFEELEGDFVPKAE